MEQKLRIYLFSSTHWDREWYQSFQGFRRRLVDMTDDLIESLESHPEFPQFTFDGQTIVLRDYLEIAPENEIRLRKLIREGRILIGPWYVMPDEYLVSGEGLIRNLLIGTALAREFGVEPMRYGYICDIFGHAAQTPQIFAGFGFEGTLLGRGTNEADFPAHFLWESPDGTRIITFKLADEGGYGDFFSSYLNQLSPDASESEKDDLLRQVVERERSRSDIPVVLLMDGLDHMHIHTEALLDVKARLSRLYPDAEICIGGLENMVHKLQPYRGEMPVKVGELNDTAREQHGYVHLITNTLSSRYDIKQKNDAAQTELEKWSGLFTVLTALEGHPLRTGYYRTAWRHVIENHPHDSICGCSIDQVHRDMHYRFDQALEIGAEISHTGLRTLSDGGDSDGAEIILTVMNPLPFPRNEAVSIKVYFPADWKWRYSEPFGYEEINAFQLLDEDGKPVPFKVTDILRDTRAPNFGERIVGDRHTLTFTARTPACGFARYRIVPSGHPVRSFDTLRTGTLTAENRFIRVTVTPDGTLDLEDLRTGRVYTDQLRFSDDGEIGDGWYHCAPAHDRQILSAGAPAVVSVEEDSPARCVFGVEKTMLVPARVERSGELRRQFSRSAELTPVKLFSRITVDAESPLVRIDLTIENTARDHRLRLLIPTGIQKDEYTASEAFCTVTRRVSIPKERELWREAGQHEKAMERFAFKRDDTAGLAFVSGGGLHEIGAFDDADGTLAVTLLRCIGQMPFNLPAEDGELLGKWNYTFGLLPMTAETTAADIQRTADSLAAGLRDRQDAVVNDPNSHSYFSLSSDRGSVCCSTLKPAEDDDGVILRLYSLSNAPDTARCGFDRTIQSAELCTLEESPLEELSPSGSMISIPLSPWQILTLRLRF